MTMMARIKQIELAVRNFSVVWDQFEQQEKEHIGYELATKIKQLQNPYAKNEAYRRIFQYRAVRSYIEKYL